MVARRTKGHKGAPSRAVDSIDCTGMSASGSDPKTTSAKRTNSKATARRRWPRMTMHSSGQARVRLNGKAHYLGPWKSPEAHERYAALLKQWEANGREPIGPRPITAVEAMLTVRDLSAQYLSWIDGTRRYHKGDKPTSQRRVAGRALSLFEGFAGAVPVRRLNEPLLIQWRDRLEGEFPRWTRETINRTFAHVLRMLAWGRQRHFWCRRRCGPTARSSNREAWCLRQPAREGATEARGSCRRRREGRSALLQTGRVDDAAATADVDAARRCLRDALGGHRQERAERHVDLHRRGRENRALRTRNTLCAAAGSAAHPRPVPALPAAFIFSPAKAMADRHAARKRQRKGCATRRVFNNKWHPVCYRQHVVAACEKASVQMFTPHELRHKAITHAANTVGVHAATHPSRAPGRSPRECSPTLVTGTSTTSHCCRTLVSTATCRSAAKARRRACSVQGARPARRCRRSWRPGEGVPATASGRESSSPSSDG